MSEWVDQGNYWEHTSSQRDERWKEVRLGRITTTASGPMAGHSSFKTIEEQSFLIAGIKEQVFDKESLERMNHGTEMEPYVRNWYAKKYNYRIVERGLTVPKWDPLLGASVDGDILETDGIIEIKCPVKMYGPLKQYTDQVNVGWKPQPSYVKHIWPTHYDQMQHAMVVLGKKWCTYIVCSTTDKCVFVQKIDFDPVYWENHYRTLKENYEKYIRPHLRNGYPIMPPSYS